MTHFECALHLQGMHCILNVHCISRVCAGHQRTGYALVASLTLVVGLVLLTHVTRGIHISEETCEYV